MDNQSIITSIDLMDDAVSTITRSGASGSVLAEFKAIGEATATDGSSKYSHAPVMVWLAKFIVGSAGGPHKDAPLFELCHLVSAIDALGENGADDRSLFFLGVEKALPAYFRTVIDDKLELGDWQKPGFERTESGLAVHYDDQVFEIRFGRIPFLAALYEFLVGLDGYDFYTELNDIFDDMSHGSIDLKIIKSASNKLSARLRQYRRDHLTRTQHDEKFDRIFGFLKRREIDGQIRIDDPAVLDFWLEFSTGGEFRAYKTVFDGFINFMRALDIADQHNDLENAAIIGTDFDAQEIEPDDAADSLHDLGVTLGDWESPLKILDTAPADRIKFFKKEGERKPIEALMQYGPYAHRLPRSFIQLDSFGTVQTAITTDLQVKRGKESVQGRLDCDDAISYADKLDQLQSILGHIRQLQKATYFVLAGQNKLDAAAENVVAINNNSTPESLFEVVRNNDDLNDIEANSDIMTDAADAFKKLTRKGFDEDFLDDPDGIEGFRLGAGALLVITGQLENFLARMETLDHKDSSLEQKFEQDKAIFRKQFGLLYGDVQ